MLLRKMAESMGRRWARASGQAGDGFSLEQLFDEGLPLGTLQTLLDESLSNSSMLLRKMAESI